MDMVLKFLVSFIMGAINPFFGVWINGKFYGREVGQEQEKRRHKETVTAVFELEKELGYSRKDARLVTYLRNKISLYEYAGSALFPWQWSSGNIKDWLSSLAGSSLGIVFWVNLTRDWFSFIPFP